MTSQAGAGPPRGPLRPEATMAMGIAAIVVKSLRERAVFDLDFRW